MKNIALTRKQAIGLFCYECLGAEWGNQFPCTSDGRNGTVKCFLFDFPKTRPDALAKNFFTEDGSRIGGDIFTAKAPAKRELSDEQKERMQAGRRRSTK